MELTWPKRDQINQSSKWKYVPRIGIAFLVSLIGILPAVAHAQERQTDDRQIEQKQHERSADVEPESPERGNYDFEKLGGIVYASGEDYQLTCDVYKPDLEGPLPAILVLHGGGWRSGSKVHWIRHARKMVRYGYVIVAVNYRHAPEHKFPAQVHDVKHAIRFMKKNAEKYNIDPERIGVNGYSAGAHLAAMLGVTDEADGLEGDIVEGFEEFDTTVKAIAAGGTPTEFSWLGRRSFALGYWLGAGKTLNNDPELFEQASPITYVSEDAPPFYFYHGTLDRVVPISSPQAMHERLVEVGVESTFREYQNWGHFGLFSQTGEPVDEIIEFFDKHLAADTRKERGAADTENSKMLNRDNEDK